MLEAKHLLDDATMRIGKLREITEVAKSPGNADYDPYLHGMANGLILAVSIMENPTMDSPIDVRCDPKFISAPAVWGHDKRDFGMGEFHGSLHSVARSAPPVVGEEETPTP
jgi:hypothetical protein